MLNEIKSKNPGLPLYEVTDAAFAPYGKIISGYDFDGWQQVMNQREIPAVGNVYVAEDPQLTQSKTAQEISRYFYGEMPIQVGYCNGNSSQLNALEYHKSSEINLAVTDLVLLLSDIREIKNNTLSSQTVVGFYLKKGTAVEIYATTLHFAPSKVSDQGYKCIVVLPKGTNEPLSFLPGTQTAKTEEDTLLWMQNKWLIAHPESVPAANGAYPGITGENITLAYPTEG